MRFFLREWVGDEETTKQGYKCDQKETHENHLPILILFIVCAIFLLVVYRCFQSQVQANASCVNCASQCVHKMQYTIDFSLSSRGMCKPKHIRVNISEESI